MHWSYRLNIDAVSKAAEKTDGSLKNPSRSNFEKKPKMMTNDGDTRW